jgi:hypothetical protein
MGEIGTQKSGKLLLFLGKTFLVLAKKFLSLKEKRVTIYAHPGRAFK